MKHAAQNSGLQIINLQAACCGRAHAHMSLSALGIRPACGSDRGPCHRGQSLRLDSQIVPRTPN